MHFRSFRIYSHFDNSLQALHMFPLPVETILLISELEGYKAVYK
jgi:hypothetical protein